MLFVTAVLNFVKLFIVVVIVYSCNPAAKTTGNKQTALKTADLQLKEGGEQNQIVFLTMQISLTDSVREEYAISKTNVVYANGVMKKANADLNSAEQQYIYGELLNSRKEVIDIVRVENPLMRVFETSDEHTGRLEKHLIQQRTGELVLRFNLSKETKYISLYKLSANKLKKIYHAQL